MGYLIVTDSRELTTTGVRILSKYFQPLGSGSVPAWVTGTTATFESPVFNRESPQMLDVQAGIRAALRGERDFEIVTPGDSKTRSPGVRNFPEQVRRMLGAVDGFVVGDDGATDTRWTVTGMAVASSQADIGLVSTGTGSHSASFATTDPHTGVTVWIQAAAGATVTLTIDGTATEHTLPAGTDWLAVTRTGLDLDTHTITVTATGTFAVLGATMTYPTPRLKISNPGRGASDAADWRASTGRRWGAVIDGPATSPDLFISGLGTNNPGDTASIAAYYDELAALGVPVIVISPGGLGDDAQRPQSRMEPVYRLLYAKAQEHDWPLLDFMQVVGNNATATAAQLMRDVIHENTRGLYLEALAVADLLGGADAGLVTAGALEGVLAGSGVVEALPGGALPRSGRESIPVAFLERAAQSLYPTEYPSVYPAATWDVDGRRQADMPTLRADGTVAPDAVLSAEVEARIVELANDGGQTHVGGETPPAYAGVGRQHVWTSPVYNAASPMLAAVRGRIAGALYSGLSCEIAVLGDSKTEGYQAGVGLRPTLSWPGVLRRALGAVEGTILATNAGSDNRWSLTGFAIGTSSQPGIFSQAGAPAEATFVYATDHVGGSFFLHAATEATVTVTVDGGAEQSFTVPAGNGFTTVTPDVTGEGEHTYVLATSDAVNVAAFRPSYAGPRLIVSNLGRSGATAASWRSEFRTDGAGHWDLFQASTTPDVIMGALGTNQPSQNGPANAGNLTALWGEIAALGRPAVVITPGGLDLTGAESWFEQYAAQFDAADAHDLPLIDFASVIGTGAAAQAAGLMFNELHENAAGFAFEGGNVHAIIHP